MKLLPRTLFGQLMLALFCALIAVQAIGFWLMLDDRARLGERLLGVYSAQRIAGIISIIDQAEPGERVRLLRALNVPPTHLSLDEPWRSSAEKSGEEAKPFIERITQELAQPLAIQALFVKPAEIRRYDDGSQATTPPGATNADPARWPNRRGRGERRLYVVGQVKLADGAVLTFRHSLPQPNLEWPLRLQGLLITLGVLVALLAGWTVRRLTHPLAALADAAAGLARNLEQAPLPERGPREVARAAQAFNAMQRDLKRYLETRAQALAGVSHDLRLPITRLRLRLERLPEGALKAKMGQDLSEMDDMIGSTLEFLRAGSVAEKPVRLELNTLLESVAEDMMALGAQVQVHGQAGRPVWARPQALRRCLTNLLDNARRYGGTPIDLSLAQRGAMLEIRVEDRGPGIPPEELERVFEPYVRIEASRAKHSGGSGLGLAIARAIARAQGGEVRLEARAGGGSSAVLTLPHLTPLPSQPPLPHAPADNTQQRTI